MLRLSRHSVDRLINRVGLDPIQAIKFLDKVLTEAERVTYEQACEIAPLPSPNKHTDYFCVADPVIPRKRLVLVIRDEVLITVLTEDTANAYGTKKIMTMGGEYVGEAQRGWLQHLQVKRGKRRPKART